MLIMIGVRIPEKMKLKIEELAAQEDRTVSNYVYRILKQHFQNEGIDWENGDKDR